MFKVSILKNDAEVVFEGIAEAVVLPGEGGELTILPFHCPIIVALKRGFIKVDKREFLIFDGIVRVENNELHAIVE